MPFLLYILPFESLQPHALYSFRCICFESRCAYLIPCSLRNVSLTAALEYRLNCLNYVRITKPPDKATEWESSCFLAPLNPFPTLGLFALREVTTAFLTRFFVANSILVLSESSSRPWPDSWQPSLVLSCSLPTTRASVSFSLCAFRSKLSPRSARGSD